MKYEDMIHLPHPESQRHPRMPLSDRAAQFSPFAALTGHEEAIQETARLTEPAVELEDEQVQRLDRKLRLLLTETEEDPGEEPEIRATYFRPDHRKSGGSYVSVSGRVKKVDGYHGRILLTDGTVIPVRDLLSIEGELFGDMED